MPNFARSASIALVAFLGCALVPRASAQSAAATQYESALVLEHRISASPAAAVDDFRFAVSRYWRLVQRYPSSAYADNALWQAGNLSMEAFRRFSGEPDKQRAAQLFHWLRDQYPHSSLAARAAGQLEQLSPLRVAAETTIRAVQREVLREVVRVTVEMDREVPFYQERLANPARLFLDLKGTKTVASLQDAALRYDSDVVREIRFGRHANSTTRIVVDVEDVGRYSVFTLYNPYRIVIDFERGAEPPVRSAPPPAPSIGKPVAPAANSGGEFSVARQLGLGVSRIVIDPGHGGHDPGATAFAVSEAELVLDIALRVEKLLQRQPGFEVVLTRRTDDYLGLDERTDIANREGADLFLSIHANASANAAARGVETYFLNFALNRQAEAVAARENAASGKTMNNLSGIIKAITLNSKLNESRDFAASIQRSLVSGLKPSNTGMKDLGVKQAPFVVLIGAAMPSVLAEISFVTNRQEARLLKSQAYRDRIAASLLAGIQKYQQALKKVQTIALK
jgi:N-acetylmuramoyl-L-alanine amidase